MCLKAISATIHVEYCHSKGVNMAVFQFGLNARTTKTTFTKHDEPVSNSVLPQNDDKRTRTDYYQHVGNSFCLKTTTSKTTPTKISPHISNSVLLKNSNNKKRIQNIVCMSPTQIYLKTVKTHIDDCNFGQLCYSL